MQHRIRRWLGKFSLDSDMDDAYFDIIMNKDDQLSDKVVDASSNERHDEDEQRDGQYSTGDKRYVITTMRGVKVEAGDILVRPKPVNQAAGGKQEDRGDANKVNQLDLTDYTSSQDSDYSPHVLDLQS